MRFIQFFLVGVLSALAPAMAMADEGEQQLLREVNDELVVTEREGGSVRIEWIDPDSFSDIRRSNGFPNSKKYRNHIFTELHEQFEELVEKLPDNHSMVVQVTNLDLAGDTRVGGTVLYGQIDVSRFGAGGLNDVRIMRQIDIPRMTISYQIIDATGDVVMQEQEVNVKDFNYLQSGIGNRASRPFYYEKRMLTKWFRKEFDELKKADA